MTQSTARIALFVGFGSGLAGAALTLLLSGPAGEGSAEDGVSASVQPKVTGAGDSAANNPVAWEPDAELAMELAQLGERLDQLESRWADSQRKPAEGYVTRTELEALLSQLEEDAGLGQAGFASKDPEGFKQDVLDAVRSVEQERLSAKIEASRERRLERLDRDVMAAGKILDLTPSQEDNLRNALQASYDREEQMLTLWREGASNEAMGALKQENHTLLQTDLGAFLTEEQLVMYNSIPSSGGK